MNKSMFRFLGFVTSLVVGSVAMGQAPWYTVLEQSPNPSVVTDASVRQKILDSGFPWRVQDISTGIEMLLVPPGRFQMGTSPGDAEAYSFESPAHQVDLNHPFYLGKTKVTQAQWQAIMGNNPSYFKNYSDSASRPVEQVSWNDVASFNTATGLRLATEAEWEYACRAGTTTVRYGVLNDIAWYGSNSGGTTHAVGGKLPNAFGFYDMLGNVWEWCNDWYGAYSSNSVTDPSGAASGSIRVMRNSSWANTSNYVRASYRWGYDPSYKDEYGGFRVARTATNAVYGVLPVSGSSAGGTAVNIIGSNFSSSPTVTFGGVSATSIVVLSPNRITAVTPAGLPGLAVLTVNGVSSEAFYYTPLCDGDFDNNGEVDSSDLGSLLINYGSCSSSLTTVESQQEPMIFQTAEPSKPR